MMPKHLGRYRLADELGRGESSVVFRAKDEQSGRELALKVVELDLAEAEPQLFMTALRQRAETAASVAHPSVVRYYSGGRDGRHAYLAMELVVGRSLRRLLQARRPLPLPTLLDFALQLADVLAHAHARNIVLGSLRPSNVLIDATGKLRLTGFTSLSCQRQAQISVDATHYLAPEQILVQRSDVRSDVFALGVLLYEMATAWPPFASEAQPELLKLRQSIIATDAPPPDKRNPTLPAALEALILGALRRDPAARCQSAAELREALRACRGAQGESVADSFVLSSPATGVAEFESSLLADIERFSRQSDMLLRAHANSERARPAAAMPEQPPAAQPVAPAAAPAAAAAPPGGNALLQRLAAQAQRVQEEETKKRQESEAQFGAGAQALEARMRQIFSYLRELAGHLDVLHPPVPRSFALFGLAEFKDLVWAGGFADFRLFPGVEGSQLIDYCSLSYVLRAPAPLRIERQGPAIEQLRRHLHDFNLAFTCEEMLNERRQIGRAVFTLSNDLNASLLFKARQRESDILMSGRNFERLGLVDYRIAAAAPPQAMLDELGKMLLGETNRFCDYAERQNPLDS